MAKLHTGILGGFSGKVGTVIGFVRGGESFIRGLATSYTDANTLAQQSHRSKWSMIVAFLKTLVAVIRIGFKNVTGGMTAFNGALSYNIKNAITGLFPDFTVNYTKVRLSNGNLEGALNPVVASLLANTVLFTWDDNSGDGDALAEDQAILVVHNPLLGKSVSDMSVTRTDGTKAVIVPEAWSAADVQCYMFFKGADGQLSISDYAGICMVA